MIDSQHTRRQMLNMSAIQHWLSVNSLFCTDAEVKHQVLTEEVETLKIHRGECCREHVTESAPTAYNARVGHRLSLFHHQDASAASIDE